LHALTPDCIVYNTELRIRSSPQIHGKSCQVMEGFTANCVRPKQWSFYCLDCGKPISGRRRCRPCWRKLYGAERVTLSCDFCGRQFERKESEARRHKFHFCSTSCKGNYAAQHCLPRRAKYLDKSAGKTRRAKKRFGKLNPDPHSNIPLVIY
jgi:hypothetical protein